MELVCVYCLSNSKDENPENDDRLTIMDGKLICVDHIPTLMEELERRTVKYDDPRCQQREYGPNGVRRCLLPKHHQETHQLGPWR